MSEGKGRIRTLLEVDETIRDLGKTLVHLETSLDTLDPVLDQLGRSLTRLDGAIIGLEQTVDRLGGVVERADRLLDVVERIVRPLAVNPLSRAASGVLGVVARRPAR